MYRVYSPTADAYVSEMAGWANEIYNHAHQRINDLNDDIFRTTNFGEYKTCAVLADQWERIARLAEELETALDELEDMEE